MIKLKPLHNAGLISPVLILPLSSLAFLAGIIALQQQAQLVSVYGAFLLVPVLFLSYWNKAFVFLLFFIAGFYWANYFGLAYLDHVPDVSLTGQDIRIKGVVSGLPAQRDRALSFRFDIEEFELANYHGPVPRHIRLSWYYNAITPKPGQHWQLMVRLKPPSGLQNPDGFDYEGWLYQQGINATGYVRKSDLNKQLSGVEGFSLLDRSRDVLRQHINATTNKSAALINALVIGYRGDMSSENWRVFINTGTSHLIAISGLHIGLIAGLSWFCCRSLSRIRPLRLVLSYRAIIIISFSIALIYAALAGFTIPTQRALIMLAIVYLGLFFYRQISVLQTLSAALLLVLIFSPVSVLSAGFWLSFLAVASIAYSIVGRLRGRNRIMLWLWPQFVVIVALIPVTLFYFQQSSLIALLANILAIPLIAIIVLPVLLISVMILPFSHWLSSKLMILSAELVSWLYQLLSYLAEFKYAIWINSVSDIVILVLTVMALIMLLAPYAIPSRILSVFLLLPLITLKNPVQEKQVFFVNVLDVGQGLSVFIKTAEHALLFDTGARFSSRFDVGEKIVVPYLRHERINYLDRLIISNGDNDHIGGAEAVLRNIEVAEVLGRDIDKLSHHNKKLCTQGQKWQWDGVDFEILHPQHQYYQKRNNYSCVLKVSSIYGSVLVAADIEQPAEAKLVSEWPQKLKSDVLIVPHHGSNTSSSLAFLQRVSPEVAIYSSGYLNRYRFPKQEVVKRYQNIGSKQLNTALTGHISFAFDQLMAPPVPRLQRQEYRRYWHRR